MSPIKIIVAGVVLSVLSSLAFGSCAVVPPGSRGVRVTLGRPGTSPLPQGIAFKVPLIQSVELVSVKQESATEKAPCFSADLQELGVTFTAVYRVKPERTVDCFVDYKGDLFANYISPRVQEAFKQVTAIHRAEDAVKQREKIKADVLALVRARLPDIFELLDLTVTNIDLSDSLETAIEQKVVQEQVALQKNFELSAAQKQAEIAVTTAKGQAEANLTVARAGAEAVKVRGEAIRMYPEVMRLELIQKWNGVSPQTILNAGSGVSVILPMAAEETK